MTGCSTFTQHCFEIVLQFFLFLQSGEPLPICFWDIQTTLWALVITLHVDSTVLLSNLFRESNREDKQCVKHMAQLKQKTRMDMRKREKGIWNRTGADCHYYPGTSWDILEVLENKTTSCLHRPGLCSPHTNATLPERGRSLWFQSSDSGL